MRTLLERLPAMMIMCQHAMITSLGRIVMIDTQLTTSLVVIGTLFVLAVLWLLLHLTSRIIWFATKRAGTATPADMGLEYEEHWIEHSDRRLQSWLVRAPQQGEIPCAMLLFQGGSRVISELIRVQKYLCEHGISSMVFDVGGNGNSTGRAERDAIRDDGVAAFRRLRDLIGDGPRIFLCGFSRSAGRVLAAISEGGVAPDGVILIGSYTTTRDVMLDHLKFVPRALGELFFPVYWDNLKSIREVRCPIMLVHSMDDEVVPIAQARRLRMAGHVGTRLATVSGLKHDDSLKPLHEEYWAPIFEFVEYELQVSSVKSGSFEPEDQFHERQQA